MPLNAEREKQCNDLLSDIQNKKEINYSRERKHVSSSSKGLSSLAKKLFI